MNSGQPSDMQSIPIAPDAQRYTVWYQVFRDGYITHYTKDHVPGKGRPLVTVCVLTEKATKKQFIGYSICSPRDMPNRKIGRDIARGRAEKACAAGVLYHIYKHGLGRTPQRVLRACGLVQCVYPERPPSKAYGIPQGDWLCAPLRLKLDNKDAGIF